MASLVRIGTFLLGLLSSVSCFSQAIDVAVASNFMAAAKALQADFEQRGVHRINLVAGSTGKHYAQIINGAPFDIFLAADRRRPQLLEQQGRAVQGSRFSYAIGQLVLWSAAENSVDDKGRVLDVGEFKRLAIANPKLAPYGRAAQQVLENKAALQGEYSSRLLRGENINQAFQFVHSGNAELGFVALSQLKTLAKNANGEIPGSHWVVPNDLYDPIEQQAVQLSDDPAASAFLRYLKSPAGQSVIAKFGYLLPVAGDT
ncbi:molybdate ABC transporter substrate-binding protein [Porticoccus sp. W117]|uniref:molybdate ABC transporter substrate-binding protein n=1 Tax=Porticoccus sp. W117 TaxID=3054777 RepID=UPI0025939299|nr:molybdate ABC transporter substrate-binding protein [Porticoccus sp. W117]MDM3872195.1 molybdate ABC transporter substrate-binding protein [Porticoccus sp. W117]